MAFSQCTTEKNIRPESPDSLYYRFEDRYHQNPYKIHLVTIISHAIQPRKLKKFSCKKIAGIRSIGISRSSAFDLFNNLFCAILKLL